MTRFATGRRWTGPLGDGLDGTMMPQPTSRQAVSPCFTPGTTLATPRGERRVEDLRVGDKIITRDNGIQEIRWAGTTWLGAASLSRAPYLNPILIRAGALGHGLPERDMRVSPQHRMLVASDRAVTHFHEREVLVAAKHLINGRGVRQVAANAVHYIHFMFDAHQVILSNGAWTESFQPNDYTLGGMGNGQRNEILDLFPDVRTVSGLNGYAAARKTLTGQDAALMDGL
ncbi:MAG: Hint domain-containing protein [Rhodobacteraceae bacterium]|nr:Hint domain-containing protein [Paracoccaceae bacterium]